MIRINLLRDVGSGASVKVDEQLHAEAVGAGMLKGFSDNAKMAIKVALIIGPSLALFLYRQVIEGALNLQLSHVKAQSVQIDRKLDELKPVLNDLERFQAEKKRLDSQLEVIKNLSRERLQNVKSLDALQDLIPQKAWLTELKIEDNKVSLSGSAVDDMVISEFMQALESSIFFQNVTLGGSEEEKSTEGIVKKFVIQCTLENM